MPLCLLSTNLKDGDITAGVETELANEVARVLSKPIEKVSVLISAGQRMFRLGSTASACLLQIHSIGVFDPERNKTYGPPLLDFLKTKLNIPVERIIVQFIPLDGTNIAQVWPK